MSPAKLCSMVTGFLFAVLLLAPPASGQDTNALPLGPLNGGGHLLWHWKPVSPLGPYTGMYQRLKEQETVRRSFSLGTAPQDRKLEIDNFTGSIEVTGTDSDHVELVLTKTFRANSKEELERARKDVSLDVAQDGGSLKFVVNGQFRCHDDCAERLEHQTYSVKMDFNLRVPEDMALKLRTVNEGDIRVSNIRGTYEIHNVNGSIDMQEIAGYGAARAVNSGVKVAFSENPKESSVFAALNGNVELRFAKGLSADFRLKTFNGGIASDFPMYSVPSEVNGDLRDGKLGFSFSRYTLARVGSGGPEVTVETLNGNIRILEDQ